MKKFSKIINSISKEEKNYECIANIGVLTISAMLSGFRVAEKEDSQVSDILVNTDTLEEISETFDYVNVSEKAENGKPVVHVDDIEEAKDYSTNDQKIKSASVYALDEVPEDLVIFLNDKNKIVLVEILKDFENKDLRYW
tara:strand:- start:288 stop:707 length:420 start_codon:yes stop_codon:yes gene_type:complete